MKDTVDRFGLVGSCGEMIKFFVVDKTLGYESYECLLS